MNFDKKYAEYKSGIETFLQLPGLQNQLLAEPIMYSLNAGGKRVRPMLTLAFCEAYGGNFKTALPIAGAIEIMHTSTLIQDDLPCMDDDDTRRGKPACHKAYGEADAVLAASAMSYYALQGVAVMCMADGEKTRVIEELCECMGVMGVYGGQKLDLMDTHKGTQAEEILAMYRMKTCALIRAACVCGCLTAGAKEEQITNAAEFADNLGLAFQITDDILDETGNAQKLGKPVKSDIKNEKHTYSALAGLEEAKKQAAIYTEKAQELLNAVPDNGFLKTLVKKLSEREK